MTGCHSISISLFDEARHLLVVKISGSLEHGNSESFLRDALAILSEYQNSLELVELDVGGVTYIDSSGIGAFVELYKYLSAHDIEMHMENVRPGVKKVMGLLGLERFLQVK
jgi:anti-anti-sigma factor